MTLAEQLTAERHGLSFSAVLKSIAGNAEFVRNFDALRGTNLAMRGSALDLEIDRATGRLDADCALFVEFCWDTVFLRFGGSHEPVQKN